MEYIVCGIDAGTGAPIWDVFDLEFASAAPAQGGRAGSVCLGLGAHPLPLTSARCSMAYATSTIIPGLCCPGQRILWLIMSR